MRTLITFLLGAILISCRPTSDKISQKKLIIFNIDEGTNMAVSLSPDRSTLAFDLLGRIWLMPAEGGVTTAITDSLGNARQPQWSPDGNQLTFQAYWDGNWHIYTINRDGSNLRQMTTGDFDYREPDWSPDGTSLVFSSDRAGSYDIWSLDIVAEQLQRVTSDPGNEHGPRWSPDEGHLAYVAANNEGSWIMTRSLETGDVKRLYAGKGRLAGISWSQNGNRLVFHERSRSLSRLIGISSQGDEATVLTSDGEDVFPFPVAWISDNDFIYTASGKIKIRTESTKRDEIPFQIPVVLDRSSYERKKRDLRGAGPYPAKGIVWPALSPDGQKIAFVALQDLWIRNTDGSLDQLTNDPYVQILPTWSPDGSAIAYSSDVGGSFGIWIHNLENSEATKLMETGRSASGISWSPDGSSIAYTQSFGPRGGQLKVADVATGESRSLGQRLGSSVGAPTWSPDSKIIALTTLDPYSTLYREGVNRIVLFSVDKNTQRPQEAQEHWSFGVRGNDGPIWSPDGKHMLVKGMGTLWLMPVDENGDATSEPKRLTTELSDAPSWSADSRSVLYMATDRLKIVNVEDRSTQEVPINLTWNRQHPETRVVINAGGLIDGISNAVMENMDVVIEGSRITEIVPHDDNRQGDIMIDASDAILIPGLIDVHAHEGSGNGESLGRAWLSWGVTTMRNPSGDPYDVLNRREAIQSGKAWGPRIFYTGGPIDGTRIYYGGASTLQSEDQIDMELNRAVALDYDLIKTYVRLPDPLQKKVVEGAHKIGIPVTSHEVFPAVGYGADGTEHVSGTSRIGYSSKLSGTFRSYGDVTDLLAKSGMSFTPTTAIISYRYVIGRDSSVLDDVRIDTFAGDRPVGIPGFLEPDWEDAGRLYTNLIQMVKDVKDKGGWIVAGTDSPIIPYGFGLHVEMETYQDAGLTPFEVLQTATVNNARLLNASDDLGSIEVGKLADIVILEANPLEDIRNARQIRTVIKNGEVYDLSELLRRK